MNVRSLKLAGATAGLLFLVGAAPLVHAQSTQVLSMNNFSQMTTVSASSETHSKFTFLGSLAILPDT